MSALHLLGLFLLLFALGCEQLGVQGSKKNSQRLSPLPTGPTPTPIFSSSEIAWLTTPPSDGTPRTSEEVTEGMTYGEFGNPYTTDPADLAPEAPSSEPDYDWSGVKIYVDGQYVTIAGHATRIETTYQEDQTSVTVLSDEVDVYYRFNCPGGDQRRFHGHSIAETMEDEEPCTSVTGQLEKFSQIRLKRRERRNVAGQLSYVFDAAAYTAKGDATGSAPCGAQFQAQTGLSGPHRCVDTYYTLAVATSDTGQTLGVLKRYERSAAHDVVERVRENDDTIFPLSGTLNIMVDNWRGTLTYTGQGATWQMTSSEGVALTGSLSAQAKPAASLRLTGDGTQGSPEKLSAPQTASAEASFLRQIRRISKPRSNGIP